MDELLLFRRPFGVFIDVGETTGNDEQDDSREDLRLRRRVREGFSGDVSTVCMDWESSVDASTEERLFRRFVGVVVERRSALFSASRWLLLEEDDEDGTGRWSLSCRFASVGVVCAAKRSPTINSGALLRALRDFLLVSS